MAARHRHTYFTALHLQFVSPINQLRQVLSPLSRWLNWLSHSLNGIRWEAKGQGSRSYQVEWYANPWNLSAMETSCEDEIKSCSDKPDAAWDWLIMEVYNTVDERDVLEERLSDPGKFTTLDTKLAAALTRSAKGDLANRIINCKEEKAKLGIQVRGRMILLMFDDYFKTSEEAGSLYRVEGLLNVWR